MTMDGRSDGLSTITALARLRFNYDRWQWAAAVSAANIAATL